jgi:hypothetical protein
MGTHRKPAHIHRVGAGGPSRGVTTPVPHVYLPVSLTAPGPSGSPEPTRLRRGCSHPPRRSPAQAASSSTPPLRRQGDGRSLTPIRNNSASWRTCRRTRISTSFLASDRPSSTTNCSGRRTSRYTTDKITVQMLALRRSPGQQHNRGLRAPHAGAATVPPDPRPSRQIRVSRRDRLGGLLHEYAQVA